MYTASDRKIPTLNALADAWNSRTPGKDWPLFLERVQIDGLRGWVGEGVDFRFPVVAIAGENGAGKSTVLKVAAAAYEASQKDGHTFIPTTSSRAPFGKVSPE
ncbi:AAA family ATPase [Kitasatospora saccharophila]|uniref:AAA family ATPase n=1 Tax=Kitasatospora saccharophila TaxID=407973 RepID=UPI003642DE86